MEKLKILGVYFCSYKCASHIGEDWLECSVKIKRLISIWEERNSNIVGKICIIKTFLISKVVCVMQALVVPEKVLIEINRLPVQILVAEEGLHSKSVSKG